MSAVALQRNAALPPKGASTRQVLGGCDRWSGNVIVDMEGCYCVFDIADEGKTKYERIQTQIAASKFIRKIV